MYGLEAEVHAPTAQHTTENNASNRAPTFGIPPPIDPKNGPAMLASASGAADNFKRTAFVHESTEWP